MSNMKIHGVTKGTKVQLRENFSRGTVNSTGKNENGFEIKLEDGRIVRRNLHEFVISKEAEEVETPEMENPEDKVTVDIPLLIRLMEYAKEDATNDLQLHKVAENLTAMMVEREEGVLSIEDYEAALEGTEELGEEGSEDEEGSEGEEAEENSDEENFTGGEEAEENNDEEAND